MEKKNKSWMDKQTEQMFSYERKLEKERFNKQKSLNLHIHEGKCKC